MGSNVIIPDKNKYFDLLKREAHNMIVPPKKNCKI